MLPVRQGGGAQGPDSRRLVLRSLRPELDLQRFPPAFIRRKRERFYNYLCIAFGYDPATFKFLVDQNVLPQRRAARCASKYFALRFAFAKEILPHVDMDLLKKVQGATWLLLDGPEMRRPAIAMAVPFNRIRSRISSMNLKPIAAALACAAACATYQPSPAVAQPQPLAFNSRVAIDYIDPRVQRSQATLDCLRKREALEELSQFLSPLRLPRILRIRTKSCGW